MMAKLAQKLQRERERERERENTTLLPHSYTKISEINSQDMKEQLSMENFCMQEYLSATSIEGLIKNAEGKIGGKITYARITIRKLKGNHEATNHREVNK